MSKTSKWKILRTSVPSNVQQRMLMSRHNSLNQPLTSHRCSVFWNRHRFAHNAAPTHRSSAVYWLREAQTAPVCCADGPGDWNSIGFLWKIICGRRLVYQGKQMELAAPGLGRFHRIDQALKKKRVGPMGWGGVVDLHPLKDHLWVVISVMDERRCAAQTRQSEMLQSALHQRAATIQLNIT